jgi:putative endonuclease
VADRPQAIDRRARGASVEVAARDYLLRAGLREVAANASYRGGELDLVMLDGSRGGDVLVFIEVRYRRDPRFGGGAASIDAGKRRKLVHAAQVFLHMHGQFAKAACRFDVIDASGDPDRPDIAWLRDAFRADDA